MGREAKEALFEQFARIGKALGAAKRVELIDLLAPGERSVGSLAGATGVNLTTVSAHLQTLRQAHLVTTRRQGTRIYYRPAGPAITDLYLAKQRAAEEHLPELPGAAEAFLGPDDVEEIGRDELWRRAERGSVTVIDVRPAEEHAAGHLPGAVSIPLDQLADRLAELPPMLTSSPTAAGRTARCPTPRCGCCATTADPPVAWRAASSSGAHRPAGRRTDALTRRRCAPTPAHYRRVCDGRTAALRKDMIRGPGSGRAARDH